MLRASLLAAAAAAAASAHLIAAPRSVLESANPGRLAAKELQRYLRILGVHDEQANLLAVSHAAHISGALGSSSAASPLILVAPLADARNLVHLTPECTPQTDGNGGYALCHSLQAGASLFTVIGSDAPSTLYGAYALLESLGMRFSIEGPIFPPMNKEGKRTGKPLPPPGFSSRATPAFALRGLQPFHDFFSGPDWWSADEHKRVIESITALKGNVIGFHTYPISVGNVMSTGTNEPAVWLGLSSQVAADGSITGGQYPTSWASTLRAQWGMTAMNTSDYPFGAAALYTDDCYGHPLQSGNATLCPYPKNDAASLYLQNAVGALWQDTFAFAAAVGVKTILGTEIPMSYPPLQLPNNTLIPLNVFFSSSRDDHFATATDCDECEGLYVLQGVAGYCYYGDVPGSIALSTWYNGQVDDNVLAVSPPDASYGFVRTECYALPPSSSGTPGTTPLNQYLQTSPKADHWACTTAGGACSCGNATAQGYSNTGVIAQIFTAGTALPTKQDYYYGALTRLQRLLGNNLSYYWVWTPEGWEWDDVNVTNPVVTDAIDDTVQLQAAWQQVVQETSSTMQLATCGWVLGPLGARALLDTVLPPNWSMSSIDMDVGNTPVDPAYNNITRHSKWIIPWMEDDPGLTAPEIWLSRGLNHSRDGLTYNASGVFGIHWRTREVGPQMEGTWSAFPWNTSITAPDFWSQWATAAFSSVIGAQAAAVFTSIDSYSLPRPVSWTDGPGAFSPSASMCNWASTYSFVDTLTALRPALLAGITNGQADLSNLERFDYWSDLLQYMRAIAVFECDWQAYNDVIAAIQAIKDPQQQQAAARSQGFAARTSLVQNASTMMWHQLAAVSSVGFQGITSNVLSHSLYKSIGAGPTATLEGLAGEPLPAAAMPPTTWDPSRNPLLRVQTVRTIVLSTETQYNVQAFVLAGPNSQVGAVTLNYRLNGSSGSWQQMTLTQAPPAGGVVRQVYTGAIPLPAGTTEADWYLSAPVTGTGAGTLYFPPTAPAGPVSVTVL